MLHNYIEQFLHYCQVSNFPPKSIEAFRLRLRHFNRYCQTIAAQAVSDLSYQHLLDFVADFDSPSVHVKKSRLWALRHFYHFLKLNRVITDNLATQISYPNLGKRVIATALKIKKFVIIPELNTI